MVQGSCSLYGFTFCSSLKCNFTLLQCDHLMVQKLRKCGKNLMGYDLNKQKRCKQNVYNQQNNYASSPLSLVMFPKHHTLIAFSLSLPTSE